MYAGADGRLGGGIPLLWTTRVERGAGWMGSGPENFPIKITGEPKTVRAISLWIGESAQVFSGQQPVPARESSTDSEYRLCMASKRQQIHFFMSVAIPWSCPWQVVSINCAKLTPAKRPVNDAAMTNAKSTLMGSPFPYTILHVLQCSNQIECF